MTLGAMSHVCLSVRDLEASVRFYDHVLSFLGYSRSETRADYAEWEGPAGWFILRPARRGSAKRRHDRYGPGLHHLAWRADSREEIDHLHTLLRAMGARIEAAPAAYPNYAEGYYAVYFLDPDGIKLELAHTPDAPDRAG